MGRRDYQQRACAKAKAEGWKNTYIGTFGTKIDCDNYFENGTWAEVWGEKVPFGTHQGESSRRTTGKAPDAPRRKRTPSDRVSVMEAPQTDKIVVEEPVPVTPQPTAEPVEEPQPKAEKQTEPPISCLAPLHLEDLRKSGLNNTTILAAGIKSIRPTDIDRLTGVKMQGVESAYELPFDKNYSRYRLFYFAEGAKTNKNRPKYLACRGSDNRLYFPQTLPAEFLSGTSALFIVEGEKKTLRAVQEGIPSIGITGVWTWNIKDTRDLIPDFDQVNLDGRVVKIVPDSDWQKAKLKSAIVSLADALIIRGATVHIITLPQIEDEKVGLDDYLMTHTAEEFYQLSSEQTEQSPKSKLVPYISAINKNHFVSREGGRTFVFSEHYDDVMDRSVLQKTSFKDFENFYLNKKVVADDNKLKPIGKIWLEHPDRREYSSIVLEPGKDVKDAYNLWRGFSVQPESGSWRRMRDHIFHIICSTNEPAYHYVIGWLATAVQKPGLPAETALVLRGKRGTGKSMLGKYMCKLFGGNGAQITSSKYLTGNFNSHLRDVVFLFADEAFWAGDKNGESVLKGLITEPTLTIEGKGRDVVFVKNMLHIIMASNNDWVVPAGLEERRFCVLDVSDSMMQDKDYFGALVNEMDNGGRAAMLHDLLEYDLSQFEIRNIPQTNGLFEQKLQSMDDFHQWWYHRLMEGEISPDSGWNPAPTGKLYAEYAESLATRAVRHRSGETEFGMALKKVLPQGWPQRKRKTIDGYFQGGNGHRQAYHYIFPELSICREHFETLISSKVDWEEN